MQDIRHERPTGFDNQARSYFVEGRALAPLYSHEESRETVDGNQTSVEMYDGSILIAKDGVLFGTNSCGVRPRLEPPDSVGRRAVVGFSDIHSKATNPKDALASNKLDLSLCPEIASIAASLAFTEGAMKYGQHNWRVAGARASVYYSAARRHLAKWLNGSDADEKSLVPHLGSVIACCAIILDAQAHGVLVDDRPPSLDSVHEDLLDLDVPDVLARLRDLFGGVNPRHYTIDDEIPEALAAPKPGTIGVAVQKAIVEHCAELAERKQAKRDRRAKLDVIASVLGFAPGRPYSTDELCKTFDAVADTLEPAPRKLIADAIGCESLRKLVRLVELDSPSNHSTLFDGAEVVR